MTSGTLWYQKMSADTVQYQAITSVTAQVASSSLVVPAIPIQALTPVEEFSRGRKKVQIPREASNSAHSSPITNVYFLNRRLRTGADRISRGSRGWLLPRQSSNSER